jgi:hypothetical protein
MSKKTDRHKGIQQRVDLHSQMPVRGGPEMFRRSGKALGRRTSEGKVGRSMQGDKGYAMHAEYAGDYKMDGEVQRRKLGWKSTKCTDEIVQDCYLVTTMARRAYLLSFSTSHSQCPILDLAAALRMCPTLQICLQRAGRRGHVAGH